MILQETRTTLYVTVTTGVAELADQKARELYGKGKSLTFLTPDLLSKLTCHSKCEEAFQKSLAGAPEEKQIKLRKKQKEALLCPLSQKDVDALLTLFKNPQDAESWVVYNALLDFVKLFNQDTTQG
jgi:hypothetical protein